MKANELRVGNWINYKSEPCIVTMIGEFGIQSKTEDEVINAKFSTPDLKPIPLTPQILEQAGFKEDADFAHVKAYKLEVDVKGSNLNEIGVLIGEDGVAFSNYTVNSYWASNNIYFLHEIQNLVFALTGEELEIKLDELPHTN